MFGTHNNVLKIVSGSDLEGHIPVLSLSSFVFLKIFTFQNVKEQVKILIIVIAQCMVYGRINYQNKGMHLEPYLLVVFDAHADGIYQNGDHDASVEVLAFYNAPQLLPC